MRKPSVVQWLLSTRLLKARNALHTGNSIGEAMGILMPFVSSRLHGKRSQRPILKGIEPKTAYATTSHTAGHCESCNASSIATSRVIARPAAQAAAQVASSSWARTAAVVRSTIKLPVPARPR
jgi:hypothetical protein